LGFSGNFQVEYIKILLMNKQIVVVIGIFSALAAFAWYIGFSSGRGSNSSVIGANVSVSSSSSGGSVANTQTYSLAEVASHGDSNSCWSVINGKVYDLSSYINQHPGGSREILQICGTDGSSAFNFQHGNERRPNSELKSFYIGELSS
jgi:predicted heme/steroid binding protein